MYVNCLATCVLIKHGEVLVANLGDSRAVASVGGLVKPITQAAHHNNVFKLSNL